MPKKKIVIICGPTGAGKTGFAIDLARRFGAEIIGADSMQIYRYMDIGTAKPTASEQAAAVHHLIDVVDPDEDFDAAAYASMATTIIKKVIARGNIPLVVGGTGFYIKALLYGLFERGGADETIREQLNQRAETEGSAALHRQLTRIDPASAARIHVNDTYRIVRALEVHAVTGEPLSVFQKRHGFREPRFDALEIGLAWPRPVLYDRINRRVDAMMDQGFFGRGAAIIGPWIPPASEIHAESGVPAFDRGCYGRPDHGIGRDNLETGPPPVRQTAAYLVPCTSLCALARPDPSRSGRKIDTRIFCRTASFGPPSISIVQRPITVLSIHKDIRQTADN